MKQDWVNKKLIDIADVSTGKHDANHAAETGKYRFYTCAYNYGMCNTNRFSGESLILPGNGVNVGEVFYYDGEFDAYQRTYVVNNIKIFPKYLHYHMLLYWKELGTRLQYGSATNFIKIGNFQNYDVSFPPLPEQKRIVAILDEAFAAIEKAKANAEKNLRNAKELFESYLNGVFDPSTRSGQGTGEDWEEKQLGEVCEFVRGPFGGSLKKNIFKRSGYAVYEQQHAIYDQFQDVRYFIDEIKFNEMKRFELKEGDLIMSCSGTMGKVAITPKGIKKGIINQALLKITTKKLILNTFLNLWMKSGSFQNSLKKYSGGAAIQNVASVSILKNIEVPIPPVKEQNLIVQKFDTIHTSTIELEAVYQKKLKDLDELKKSILQKAFSGELTAKKELIS